MEPAEGLRGRYRVGMISNATLKLEEELRDYHGIDQLFDVVVNSARVGLAKPDPRIFRLTAERVEVEATACLHIDDLWQNVLGPGKRASRRSTMRAQYPSLERELRSLGVEWQGANFAPTRVDRYLFHLVN